MPNSDWTTFAYGGGVMSLLPEYLWDFSHVQIHHVSHFYGLSVHVSGTNFYKMTSKNNSR